VWFRFPDFSVLFLSNDDSQRSEVVAEDPAEIGSERLFGPANAV
jgi:hypothetical protein